MGLQGLAQENEEYRKELKYFKSKSSRQMVEIEKLKNKLSKIKELINRTPRQTPIEIAYIWLKSEIAEIIGDDNK